MWIEDEVRPSAHAVAYPVVLQVSTGDSIQIGLRWSGSTQFSDPMDIEAVDELISVLERHKAILKYHRYQDAKKLPDITEDSP